jgi:inhibitor of cysteine peptidase
MSSNLTPLPINPRRKPEKEQIEISEKNNPKTDDKRTLGINFTKKGMFYFASLLGLAVIIFLIAYANFPISFKGSETKVEKKEVIEKETKFKNKYLESVKRFSSEDEFADYIQQGELLSMNQNRMGGWAGGEMMTTGLPSASLDESSLESSGAQKVSRYSETNVQVSGIDEPDVLKTDGENIFFSREQYWRNNVIDRLGMESWDEKSLMPAPINEVDIVKAFPPEDLKKIGKIEKKGNLLVKDNILAVIAMDGIYGYDISNPGEPKEIWKIKLNENRTSLVSARLFGEDIYLITQSRVNRYRPCPVEPFLVGEEKFTVSCSDIYRPETVVPVDSTFQIVEIGMADGKLNNSVTFVGSAENSLVYVSPKNIYVTYTYQGDFVGILVDFFELNNGLIPDELETRIKKLSEYDISASAKSTEISQLIENYLATLTDDDQLKLRSDLENKMSDYLKVRQRDLEYTGVARINLSGLKVEQSGSVPGHPLNQFSLDEYNNELRMATTSDSSFWWMGFGGRGSSVNDVYILDTDMKIKSSVKDLGKGERIYSVRFIEDQGYVVTFRQIDPFYVINLANSNNPYVSGELKIPGYSAYLHPLKENIILGVGMEDQKVKISLFDVSDASAPKEIDKYNLGEYWTDVSSTHHAFLEDKDHEIFFLPGGEGGYIFSYKDNKLDLVKAVSDVRAKRAAYINNYFYIVSDEKVTVLNESDWEKIDEINL